MQAGSRAAQRALELSNALPLPEAAVAELALRALRQVGGVMHLPCWLLRGSLLSAGCSHLLSTVGCRHVQSGQGRAGLSACWHSINASN